MLSCIYTVFIVTLDRCPVRLSKRGNCIRRERCAYQQYAIVCRSLRDNVLGPSRDIAIKSFECSAVRYAAEVLCTLWPSLKMNVPLWLYQTDKQEE